MRNELKLASIAKIIMGTSPKGNTYNNDSDGLPLLNGPTEFETHHPDCTLYTTNSIRECEKGDLIFCVRGSTTGRMNWANKVYSLGRGVCSIRGNSLKETYYIRMCLEFKLESLLKLAGGGTFPNLTKDTIHDFKIPYDNARFKIADILSAYDDLIENNNKRIKILEEMAQNLYREWFVKFRFPIYRSDGTIERIHNSETDPMKGSPLGKIPVDWELAELKLLCDVIPGYAFKSKDWQKDGIPVIKIKNISADNTVNIYGDSYVSSTLLGKVNPKYTINNGDILIAMTGATAGKVGFVHSSITVLLNQRVAKLKPDKNYFAMLWAMFSTKECQDRFYSLADGAAQPNMSGKQIENFTILKPSLKFALEFKKNCHPMIEQIGKLYLKNQNLKQQRDLLLPKLISGEIEVGDVL